MSEDLDNLDWERALALGLERLPPLADGHVRLYRVEPAVRVPVAPWIAWQRQEMNLDKGEGRWFTDDPQALLFYVKDQALSRPTLLTLDVPADQAAGWQVRQWQAQPSGENPQAFSRDPDREYFLPDLALRPTQGWELPHLEKPALQVRRGPRP
jgi:hypothetical protein